jgi:hypothetical protein
MSYVMPRITVHGPKKINWITVDSTIINITLQHALPKVIFISILFFVCFYTYCAQSIHNLGKRRLCCILFIRTYCVALAFECRLSCLRFVVTFASLS